MASKRVAEMIRMARESRGWTLGDLERASGVPRPTLYELEAGSRDPRLGTIARVAAALDLSLDELAGLPRRLGDAANEHVLLAQAEIGRLLTEVRGEFATEDDYDLFRQSVVRNVLEMTQVARLANKGEAGGKR